MSHFLNKSKSKERYILEWAFMTPKKKSNKQIKTDEKKPRRSLLLLDEHVGSIQGKDLDEYDDPYQDAEFERQHRNILNSNKSEIMEKRILYKNLDTRLIDLSKQRLKSIETFQLLQNNFIKRQKKLFPVLLK
jgi:hypothetical protein